MHLPIEGNPKAAANSIQLSKGNGGGGMRRRQYRIKWFRLIMIGLAGYFIYSLSGIQGQLNAIGRDTNAARQRLEQAQQTKAALVEERERLNTPGYIEKLAREELGLAKPGETPYVPVTKN